MPDPIVPAAVPGITAAPGAQPTDDQRLIDLVNTVVGSRLERALPRALEGALAPHLARLTPQAPSAPPETDPAKRLTALEQELAASRQREAKQRQDVRETQAVAALKASLAPRVRPELLDVVASHLFHVSKAVTAGEDGSVTFAHGGQQYSLAEGVSEWAKTPQAAVFLPAPKPAPKAGPFTQPRATGPGQQPFAETPAQRTDRLFAMLPR